MLVCAIFFVPETLPKARRSDRGSTTVLQRYQSVLSRPRVHRRADHRRHDLQRTVLVPVGSSFLFQQHLRLRRAAVRPAVRGQLARRRGRRAGRLAAGGTVRSAVGDGLLDRRAGGRVAPRSSCSISSASGLWGVMIPLFVFMTACGFTFPCVQVLALDRHGKAAGTAASLIGATNFGVAGLISPIVGLDLARRRHHADDDGGRHGRLRRHRRPGAVADRATAHGRACSRRSRLGGSRSAGGPAGGRNSRAVRPESALVLAVVRATALP